MFCENLKKLLLFTTLLLAQVPEFTEELHLAAYYNDAKNSRDTYTETTAYASYGPLDRHIQVNTFHRYVVNITTELGTSLFEIAQSLFSLRS